MNATQRRDASNLGIWRIVLWAALAAIIICPLVAMQFTNEVRWDLADFAAAAVLLLSLGAVVELAFFASQRSRTRAIMIGIPFAAIMTIWAEAAVGIF
jgi:hypothetical protein